MTDPRTRKITLDEIAPPDCTHEEGAYCLYRGDIGVDVEGCSYEGTRRVVGVECAGCLADVAEGSSVYCLTDEVGETTPGTLAAFYCEDCAEWAVAHDEVLRSLYRLRDRNTRTLDIEKSARLALRLLKVMGQEVAS